MNFPLYWIDAFTDRVFAGNPAAVVPLESWPGDDCDFVSRFFAPDSGIAEDPVTGSAHCTLVPYWAARLRRDKLHARQASPRGGELWCELVRAADSGKSEERVRMAGNAVLYPAARFPCRPLQRST